MTILSDPKAIYTGNYTIGGLPEDQAEHWCEKNYQILGNFIYQMMVGKFENRRRAQCEIYYLRRKFMKPEWDEYINRLDNYRRSVGSVTVSSYFDALTSEVLLSYPEYFYDKIEVETKEKIIAECKHAAVKIVPKVVYKEEVVEQLSLF